MKPYQIDLNAPSNPHAKRSVDIPLDDLAYIRLLKDLLLKSVNELAAHHNVPADVILFALSQMMD